MLRFKYKWGVGIKEMTTSKGGLSIIDYPFAFSIAALIFPPVIEGQDPSVLLAIALFGGMVGSILMIVNPVGFLINRTYELIYKYRTLPILADISDFVRAVIARNYEAALKSPSITYEVDKLVGMLYFIGVLGLALYRLLYDDVLVKLLNLSHEQAQMLVIIAIIGMALVVTSLVYHVAGWKWRSISHSCRIRVVTIASMASDFMNLSMEGRRVLHDAFSDNNSLIENAYNTFVKLDLDYLDSIQVYKQFEPLVTEQSDLLKQAHHDLQLSTNVFCEKYWNYFLTVQELGRKYKVNLHDAAWWLKRNIFFESAEFDVSLSQLQSSIDSRDWQTADLKTHRILKRFEDILKRRA
jgi:hypothetical protein